MLLLRRQEQDRARVEDLEMHWVVGREVLAMLYNINRGKGQVAKSGTDWIKLSSDKKEKKGSTKLTPEEVEKKFPKTLKKKIK